MDDYIKRKDAIKSIDDLPNCYNGYSDTYDKAYIIGTLEEVPPSDVVEVVRCKDCQYWNRDRVSCEGLARCLTGETGVRFRNANDFCSRGEKKDG